ncbi:MAG: FmdB family zinc ribbon protein [Candidatus Limnocylindrales bacterium]
MPLYDYACTQCGRTVEVSHGVHAAGPSVCEVCGGAMRKLLSRPAIVFKGSGWAKKDAQALSHARSGKRPSSGPPNGSAGPAGSGESAHVDPSKTPGGPATSPGSSSGDGSGKAGGSGAD